MHTGGCPWNREQRERNQGNRCKNTERYLWLAAFFFFSVSPTYIHTRHNFFKISNGNTYTREKHRETERKREGERKEL